MKNIPQILKEEMLKYSIGLILLGLLIELLARITNLPNLSSILHALNYLSAEGSLNHDIKVSSLRWLMGWFVGAIIGCSFGFLTGRFWLTEKILEGLFVIFRAIPFVCLVPIAIIVFGLDESGKVFLVAWATASVCWIIVHEANKNIPQHYIWRATSLGASKSKLFFNILLPLTNKGIFSALRTSLSIGLIVVAVAEMGAIQVYQPSSQLSSGQWMSGGLGYQMFQSINDSRYDHMMAAIIIFAFLGIAGDLALRFLWTFIGKFKFWLRARSVTREIKQIKNKLPTMIIDWPKPLPVEVCGLTAGYNGTTVINDLSLTILPGNTMAIVGPSGCGKTTLIRAIGHFVDKSFKLTNGVKIDGKLVSKAGPWVGIVMQDAPVFEHLTVWDNVLFGNKVNANGPEDARLVAFNLLREFGLEPYATRKADSLSGGQRQRVAFAMTLANRPNLLLLDEPFGALDAITRRQLQQFYSKYVHGKVTAIFVTHDIEEALIIGDIVKIGVNKNGVSLETDKESLSPQEWELRESFIKQRNTIINELEKISSHDVLE